MSAQKRARTPDYDQYSRKFFEELEGESDRGAAVVGAAMLDDCLRELLEAFLINRPNEVQKFLGSKTHWHAPLGTFSARIRGTYYLGLLPEEVYNDLMIVRNIRNTFAHGWRDLCFSSKEVRCECKKLKLVKSIGSGMLLDSAAKENKRSLFLITVSFLASMLKVTLLRLASGTSKHWQKRKVPGIDIRTYRSEKT